MPPTRGSSRTFASPDGHTPSMLLEKELGLTEHSYYEKSIVRPTAAAALTGRVVTDVCVVGAGYSGLSAALELAARGYAVAVLEARQVGWGASGRNGGQAIVGFAAETALEAQLPLADAGRAWAISVEGLHLLQERIARHAIDCDYVAGYMTLAVNARKARRLDAWVQRVARVFGYPLQWIGPGEIGDWIASRRFCAGAFDAQSGHLHPLKYCLGLAAAARAPGGRIFENSPVSHVARGEPCVLRTAQGEVSCRYAVFAGNVYLSEYGATVAPELSGRIMPVGTYIIATEAMAQARVEALIRRRAAVSDTNFVLDYFRPSADHRLLFGTGDSYSARTPRKLVTNMRRQMLAVFPQLADLSIEYAWGGFVDITLNKAPDFGRVKKP